MIDPHEVPEHQFSLQTAPQLDKLIDMTPVQHQMTACQLHMEGTGAAAGTCGGWQRTGASLTPGLDELYALWNEGAQSSSRRDLQQEQQPAESHGDKLDVAALVAVATSEQVAMQQSVSFDL
jgi:hypothetical protein